MKKLLPFLLFLMFSELLFSQIVDTLYLKEIQNYSTIDNYDYYRIIEKIDKNVYSIKDYYKGDSLKSTFEYLAKKEIEVTKKNFEKLVRRKRLVLNGKRKNYYKDSLIKEESIYDKGKLIYGPVEYINGDTLYHYADIMPRFIHKSMYDFREFISFELDYPDKAYEQGIEGRVFVKFRINKQGVVEDVKLLRGAHRLLDEEAIRVISSSPKWIPGEQNGKPVNVVMISPIFFILNR